MRIWDSLRRVVWSALAAVGIFSVLAGISPAVAGAQQPAHVSAAGDFGGVINNSPSAIVSYSKGLASVVCDGAGDVLLFTKVSGATSWTRTEVYNATAGGVPMSDPALATSGKKFALVAHQSDTNYLYSWIGSVQHGFTEEVVNDSVTFSGSSPSIAYSPFGRNYVLTDTDASGNVDYWFSTTGAGGWQKQTVASTSETGIGYVQSVLIATDVGVVVVASDGESNFDSFYQPFGYSTWSENSTDSGGVSDLSIIWSGSEVYFSFDFSNEFFVMAATNTGVFSSLNALYTSESDLLGDDIAWSGSNAVFVSEDGEGNLNFFYSNSNVTAFVQETITMDTPTVTYGEFPAVVVGHDTVEVTDTSSKAKLDGWSQPVGGTGWAEQLIGK